MEEIANAKLPLWANAIVVLTGMFIYYVAIIKNQQNIKKFSEISLLVWWLENQIRFTQSCLVIAIIFFVSWYYDNLTLERSFYLGVIGNLALDKFLKFISEPTPEK